MEKIEISFFKMVVLLSLVFGAEEYIFNNSSASVESYLIGTAISVPFFMLLGFLKKIQKRGIYFDAKGVTWILPNKTLSKPWEEVRLNVKFKSRFFIWFHLNLVEEGSALSIVLFWPTQKSIIHLTKKYTPENHELHRLITSFSK